MNKTQLIDVIAEKAELSKTRCWFHLSEGMD